MTTLTTLARTLNAWGFTVIPHNVTGRPYKFNCQGIMGHHTAGPELTETESRTPSLNTIIKGRKNVPGPLSQLYLGYDALDALDAGRSPIIHLVSTGRANHAGMGGPWRSIPKDSGNAYLAGIEVENVGNNKLDPELLLLHRIAAAAVLDHINKDATWYLCHKTWTRRKPDIASVNIATERTIIQRLLKAGPVAFGLSQLQEAEVTPQDIDKIAKAVVHKLIQTDLGRPGGQDTVGMQLQTEIARDTAALLTPKLDALAARLQTLEATLTKQK